MGSAQPYTGSAVAQRLQTLARLYQQDQASELMERTLDKVLAYEADLCRAQLNQLQADLAEFEQRYGLSSTEFYRRFQTGQTDDRMDYVEWASLVQMRDNLQKRLHLLTGEAQG
jgi:AraC-like DNA-binding protein